MDINYTSGRKLNRELIQRLATCEYITEYLHYWSYRQWQDLLNQFLNCSAYDYVIFCWVMHEKSIIDEIIKGLGTSDCFIKVISLICSEETLKTNLQKDIDSGKRNAEIVNRSLSRLPLYESLDTLKITVDGKSIEDIAEEIIQR